jgi:hypothetical protein
VLWIHGACEEIINVKRYNGAIASDNLFEMRHVVYFLYIRLR